MKICNKHGTRKCTGESAAIRLSCWSMRPTRRTPLEAGTTPRIHKQSSADLSSELQLLPCQSYWRQPWLHRKCLSPPAGPRYFWCGHHGEEREVYGCGPTRKRVGRQACRSPLKWTPPTANTTEGQSPSLARQWPCKKGSAKSQEAPEREVPGTACQFISARSTNTTNGATLNYDTT